MHTRHARVSVNAGGPGVCPAKVDEVGEAAMAHLKTVSDGAQAAEDVFVIVMTSGLAQPYADDLARLVSTWLDERNLIPE